MSEIDRVLGDVPSTTGMGVIMERNGGQGADADVVFKDEYLTGRIIVESGFYLLPDIPQGRLEQLLLYRNRAVAANLAVQPVPEDMIQVGGIRDMPDALDLLHVGVQWRSVQAGMLTAVVLLIQPQVETIVELVETAHGVVDQGWIKLAAHSTEEPFDFALGFRVIWFCVYQGDTELRAGQVQRVDAVNLSVINVDHFGHAPPRERLFEHRLHGFKILREEKTCPWYKTGTVVDEREEIRPAFSTAQREIRPYGHIALQKGVDRIIRESAAFHIGSLW